MSLFSTSTTSATDGLVLPHPVSETREEVRRAEYTAQRSYRRAAMHPWRRRSGSRVAGMGRWRERRWGRASAALLLAVTVTACGSDADEADDTDDADTTVAADATTTSAAPTTIAVTTTAAPSTTVAPT